MHMQAHMSGQISGQVPNQAGPQLPGLPQQNGNSLPSQMQGLGGNHSMDQARKYMQEKIFQLCQRTQPSNEWRPRLHDVVRRLDEMLYKHASSKEEYMNIETLEHRVHTLLKRTSSTSHRQPVSHIMSSSSSISTMIPTPGMSHSGGTNSMIPSSVDNSTTSSSVVTQNTVNTGHLSANGTGGGVHGSSFNASDGAVSNGFQQSSANISGGNNMMSSMSMPRMAGQMIPTPGLNNPQSMANSESSNRVGFSSGVDSTMVSHQQQPRQYSGGQGSRILHNLSGQMGIGMRSSLQQKHSTYGFPNGTLNGGLTMIGNNIQLMNGASVSEGFLSPYSSSLKPLQQHFDQQCQQQIMQTLPQQMIPMTGEMYGMNASDLSGSGNLYGPAASVGSTMNNENGNSSSLQSKPRTNAGLPAHQHTQQTMQQQTVHMKPQPIDHSTKMNFQSSHSAQEHLIQSQQQINMFQQQELQQHSRQPYAQFVQHQQQQKQQNQQPQQLPVKNDILKQSHLTSNLGDHIMADLGTDSHGEMLRSQGPEQCHSSELQNQFQQNTSAEDFPKGVQLLSHSSGPQDFCVSLPQAPEKPQKLLYHHRKTAESQNDFSRHSAGSQHATLLQGQLLPQLNEDSHMQDQSSLEHHVQEEFRQRIAGHDEAQRPHLPLEGSSTGQGATSRSAAIPKASSAMGFGTRNEMREQQYYNQRRWLLFLCHARKCSAPEGKCQESHCIIAQRLWMHMEKCTGEQCGYPRCHGSKKLINHNKTCRLADCPVCVPVRQFRIAQLKARDCPPSGMGLANSIDGSFKTRDTGDADALTSKVGASVSQTSEELPLGKRMKMDHPSPSFVSKSETPPGSVPLHSHPHISQDPQLQAYELTNVCMPTKSEVTEVKKDLSVGSGQGSLPIFNDMMKTEPEDSCTMKPDPEPISTSEVAGHAKVDNSQVDGTDQTVKQEANALPADHASGTKSGKPKIKGVSLTELFTPEQIREHITGLRQWVGQSKAKAEKNQAMEHSMSENSCQLCAVEKLTFEPPPIYCTPCGARIKRNAMYYTTGTGDTRFYFCIPCYNEVRSETIEVDGGSIMKARLEKKKNDEETEEWWVQCDKCEAWQHQICALFNGRRNDGGQAEYTCPNCYIAEIEGGERKPLPQSAVLGAKDLPRTILSDHIEQRLSKRLKQERQDRARQQNKNIDEVPGAEALVIRVVSSVDKKLEVKQRFLEIFQEENYPTEFPYKSKVILLFQRIEGVEVCLFGMYVQEFGSESQYPNQRRVYLSYLDSVKYFRPEIKAATGEALRTFVYHEILIGYLEYCKMRGFTSCYIWACPPLKGEDYILYCHPEIQKTPKSDKLREWYLAMLRKASREDIVVDLTNLYDHFFVSTGECKAKVTAARLPYFDGDYWPGAAEDMINQLRQEEDGRKQQKKGKAKKTITKRALKAAGQADLSGNASKDALLMQKLGETICPMKEDFIMVHLQHACSHCCHLMVSGTRWVCPQCKNFQLCDKCHDAEQKLEERDRHPINSRDKHALSPFEVTGVLADTKDKDEILESEFFDTRQAFLSLCQGNHYQYDTLRRAKHSSMMVLYHLHNPTAPAFVTTCNVCLQDIESGQGWRCEICPDFDVCNVCYQKDGGVDHPHKLTNHPSTAERDAQNKEARQKRVLQLRKMLDLLVHASQCRYPHCHYPNCRRVKGLFRHGMQCKTRASGGCLLCKKMWYLLQLHARACKESECHVPRCRDLKEHLRRLQQQSDSRRRAAVMEMMRQRAAEVAGSNG
ncbi:zinc finger protein [Cinnamomum micranthum f. kanehirae]|uniref:histone acetyltransferase n=1 Tax=Cinnamomum micranthum f. kanehirae TaxID=337451 RepID=A0A3S3P6J5_9MAGN|nr:zinc finger protein [Cinnamomum micranthum f. kanehirae]